MRPTLSLQRRAGSGFLAKYMVGRTVRAADGARGVPTLRYGRDQAGRRVLIKTWLHERGAREDLRAFWLEEMRLLAFLSAQRSSEQLLARIVDCGEDADGFHCVVICGRSRILGDLIAREPSLSWAPAVTRIDLWQNISRLARALQILHDRGLSHRNLDMWSVLTHGDGDLKFQLTGFEWATRVIPEFVMPENCGEAGAGATAYGPLRDWRAFARLASDVLQVAGAARELHTEEQKVLRTLDAMPEPDGRRIEKAIAALVKQLAPDVHEPHSGLQQFSAWDAGAEAQGLLLVQVLHSVLAAGIEFPVELAPEPAGARPAPRGKYYLHLRSRPHAQREALSRLLHRRDTLSEQLHEALLEDVKFVTDTWYLIDETSTDESAGEEPSVELHFLCSSAERTYTFEASQPLPKFRQGLLVSARTGRSDNQFKRQLNAWRAMGQHRELLPAMIDPARTIRTASSHVLADDDFRSLDQAKQEALGGILRTRPLFLVQGPPGVGKTRLVAELCRQVLRAEACTKILLSAQSHAAVDHLLSALGHSQFDGSLAVRCRARGSSRASGELDVQRQVNRMVMALRSSAWFEHFSQGTRDTIAALCQRSHDTIHGRTERFHRRPLEALMLRAANIVLATANSASLEHLFADAVQFDWSIVEEAAKANGSELIAPLLLSQRYLMIGDHEQLPPFNADELAALLALPRRVSDILSAVEELRLSQSKYSEVRRLQRKFSGDEERFAQAATRVCEAARRHLLMFESLIKYATTEKARRSGRFATMLSYQHRMHPAIARLVSHAFYRDELLSSDSCVQRFSRPSPVQSRDPDRLPGRPIVWVAMPWLQSTMGQKLAEQRPGPHNVDEVKAVLQTVSLLEPDKGHRDVTLALLTPYRKQVAELEDALAIADASFRAHLRRFSMVGGSYVHTVDSFQGSEANVVVVSLVRNNHRATLAGALGFLRDKRRMNVLLSRAEWRLIIVGSMEFLRHTVAARQGSSEARDIEFLRLVFEAFDEAQRAGLAATVPAWGLASPAVATR